MVVSISSRADVASPPETVGILRVCTIVKSYQSIDNRYFKTCPGWAILILRSIAPPGRVLGGFCDGFIDGNGGRTGFVCVDFGRRGALVPEKAGGQNQSLESLDRFCTRADGIGFGFQLDRSRGLGRGHCPFARHLGRRGRGPLRLSDENVD